MWFLVGGWVVGLPGLLIYFLVWWGCYVVGSCCGRCDVSMVFIGLWVIRVFAASWLCYLC